MVLKWKDLANRTDEELRQSVRTVVAILVTLLVLLVLLVVAGAV